MRLIDAEALIKDLPDLKKSPWANDQDISADRRFGISEALDMIKSIVRHDQPTVDAVPVVRCKDCKYSVDEYDDGECYCDYENDLRYIKDWNHHCSWAERKEE